MPKHRNLVARHPPLAEKGEEEENQVSEPEPSQKQKSQVKKKPGVVAQSGKQQPSETPSANSKKPFDSVWSEDDEIVILKGMIDYRAKKKVNPKTDLDGFFEFIKNSISVYVSKTQLYNKIRSLKRKYDNCTEKVSLKKGHEQIVFKLLKKIWGTEAEAEAEADADADADADDVDHNLVTPTQANRVALKKESKDDAVMVPRAAKRSRPNVEEPTLMEGLGVESWIEKVDIPALKGEKRAEMEKWKELKMRDLEIYMKKLKLLIKQTKMILKACEH